MIAKLTKTVSAVFMSAMMLTSCSLVGEKYDMDSAEGIAKVKELIKSCVVSSGVPLVAMLKGLATA